MEKRESAEVRVEFEGFGLEEEAMDRLSKVVQHTVLSEIARLDLVRDDFIVRFPKDWLGIWIRNAGLGPFEDGGR